MSEKDKEPQGEVPIGTVIDGKYEILEVVGRGGMGIVYKAHHKFINKDVAIKLLNSQLCNSPQVVTRFQREAMASARIEHPNVCQVTDSGRTPDGTLYIVMELLQGRPLQDIIGEEAPLPISRIINISKQILSALQKAHELKIIHRDLKPENIMVIKNDDGSETVKIMDFGIAKVAIDDVPTTPLTTAGMVFGTPHYISPEQASGDPVDGRSDLYSLGCIMYEMATGKKPFESDTLGGLLRKHVTAEIPKIAGSGGDVPEKLKHFSSLVARLMAKSPDDRPSTARDVLSLLEKIEVGKPPQEDITTAETIMMEGGGVGAKKISAGVGEILKSLGTMEMEKARTRAEELMDFTILPPLLRFVSVVKKYPFMLGPWVIMLIAIAILCVLLMIMLLKMSCEGGEKEKVSIEKKSLTYEIEGERKTGLEEKKTGEDDLIQREIGKSLDLSKQGKDREALDVLEALTTNLSISSKPSFLLQLAVMRARAGKYDLALDAVERCRQVQEQCTAVPPMQEVMVSALKNKDSAERASRYLANYATLETIQALEKIAREDKNKWLRKAAFDALKEGKHFQKLEKWSRDTILFVNETGACKKKRDLLKEIREDGNPQSLPALELFSSKRGCGFMGLRDCYSCFRKELEKTIQSLKEK